MKTQTDRKPTTGRLCVFRDGRRGARGRRRFRPGIDRRGQEERGGSTPGHPGHQPQGHHDLLETHSQDYRGQDIFVLINHVDAYKIDF